MILQSQWGWLVTVPYGTSWHSPTRTERSTFKLTHSQGWQNGDSCCLEVQLWLFARVLGSFCHGHFQRPSWASSQQSSGFQETQVEASRLLVTQLLKSQNISSTTFYWPSKSLEQAHIQGEGELDCTFDRRNSKEFLAIFNPLHMGTEVALPPGQRPKS